MSQDDGTNRLDWSYSAGGKLIGFKLNGTTNYYYLYNLQGDVTGIYDADGVIVAKYYYDAWGNTTVMDGSGNEVYDETHIAYINPIRYRSYYYDSEILMYYLQSRYYSPEICRFINADALFVARDSLTGSNMFAYCGNNPVMFSDPSGFSIISSINYFISKIIELIERIKALFADPIVKYDVPLYNQKDQPLCWAFCIVMLEAYKTGAPYMSQEDAKSAAEAMAIEQETSGLGAAWLTLQGYGEKLYFSPIYSRSRPNDELSIEKLYAALLEHGPLYAAYGGINGGHSVVVTGVDVKNGLVYTNNPQGCRSVQTFDQFMAGYFQPSGFFRKMTLDGIWRTKTPEDVFPW